MRVPDYARTLAEALWPGPLTLVLKKRESVLDDVTGGGDTVAVRVPDHPIALALLDQTLELGGITAGIAAPSANPFGEEPPTTVEGVIAGLGRPAVDDETTPDMILDGGERTGGVPSTIISCVGEWPRVLRYGAMDKATIERTIGRWVDM
ncbi:MAG: L-threonylcarbamoyladenylate synthase [Myxococcota bacterium]